MIRLNLLNSIIKKLSLIKNTIKINKAYLIKI